MSAFELVGIDYLLNIALSKLLNGSIGFSFDFTALLVEFSLMLVITILVLITLPNQILIQHLKPITELPQIQFQLLKHLELEKQNVHLMVISLRKSFIAKAKLKKFQVITPISKTILVRF